MAKPGRWTSASPFPPQHEPRAFVQGQAGIGCTAGIGCRIKRQSGSRRTLARDGWSDYVFAFHDGEEAGALDTMLLKVAEYYEQEVNNAVDALASLIEPLIMVFIGVIVGGMVIGMYLPIFMLAAVVG